MSPGIILNNILDLQNVYAHMNESECQDLYSLSTDCNEKAGRQRSSESHHS